MEEKLSGRSPEIAVWGTFNDPDGSRRVSNYWNPFGRIPSSFQKNMIVQINPSRHGISTNIQGLIAKDSTGQRWILHQGRLHPGQIRISEEMFDEASKKKRVNVIFSDGTVVKYHRVANIDLPFREVQRQTALFVTECEMVRQYHLFGAKAAEEERRVLTAEDTLSPEGIGSYKIAPQKERTAVRWHGYVWRALKNGLDELGITHSNARVARYGPDLRTFGNRPVLFELKTQGTASDLQRAVGQLLLYENLLGKKHIKVIAFGLHPVPKTPS